jgi:phage-related protein
VSTVATLFVKLGLDSEGYNKGLKSSAVKTQEFGKSLTTAGKKATVGLTLPILGAGLAAVNSASNLEQSIGGVESVFGDASSVISDFGKTAADSVGLSMRSFNELSTIGGALLQNVGFDAIGAADEMIKLAERGSDVAATFGGPVENVLMAVQSAIKGEFNPLEQFGVKMNQAAINARALEDGLADSNGEISDAAKAQAALSIFYEQTAKTQGQFASESDTLAGQTERTKAKLENMAGVLGTQLLPIGLKIVEFVSGLIDKFSNLSGGQQKLILIFAAVAAAIGPIITIIGIITTVIGALSFPIVAIIAVIALLALAWKNNWGGIQEKTAAVIEWIKTNIAAFLEAVQVFWAENGETIIANITAVWEIIKGAFSAAATFIGDKIKLFLDAIKAFWAENGESIMATVSAMWETIKGLFSAAWEIIKTVFSAFKSAFEGDWTAFGEKLREAWDAAWELIKTTLSSAWDSIKIIVAELIEGVISFFSDTDWLAVGTNIITGIGNGISEMSGWLADKAKSAAMAALDAMKGFLGIESPSKAFGELGKFSAMGFGNQFQSTLGKMEPSMSMSMAVSPPSGVSAVSARPEQPGGGGFGQQGNAIDYDRLARVVAFEIAKEMG